MLAATRTSGCMNRNGEQVDLKKAVVQQGAVSGEELERRLGIPATVIEAVLGNDPDTWIEHRDGKRIFGTHLG